MWIYAIPTRAAFFYIQAQTRSKNVNYKEGFSVFEIKQKKKSISYV